MSFRRRDSRGSQSRNRRPSGSGFGDNRPPREMHKATCGDCGNECEVPFVPQEGRPVYCRDCFQKRRPY
ncbi:MAG: CxxC-x17-CxxC domain-containing protein [Candidatus Hodarchaeales archaeon]|jgi:CxxC-x17-CxxC domain-containing protein